MEQRIYHGDIEPLALADYLVHHFDPQENLQAQQIGETSNSTAVQIGHGDIPADLRNAVTVGIVSNTDGTSGITVTLGEQKWFPPNMATHTVAIGLVGLLFTPWALFGLLWPLSEIVKATTLPNDIWHAVDSYVLSMGGSLNATQDLQHPHIG